MWNSNPDLTLQLERDRHEERIAAHQRRQAKRLQKGSGMINTLLERSGDLLVGLGERMRRRAQPASQLPTLFRGDLQPY